MLKDIEQKLSHVNAKEIEYEDGSQYQGEIQDGQR